MHLTCNQNELEDQEIFETCKDHSPQLLPRGCPLPGCLLWVAMLGCESGKEVCQPQECMVGFREGLRRPGAKGTGPCFVSQRGEQTYYGMQTESTAKTCFRWLADVSMVVDSSPLETKLRM